MITWFDALLVTLWAVVTALGARRGLGGAVWGLLGVATVFLVNLLVPNAVVALVLSLLLGLGAVVASRRLVRDPLTESWHLLAGGLGGALLGGLLVGTLALSFPIQTLGDVRRYPSSDLPATLYYGVFNSQIRQGLNEVWAPQSSPVLRTLLIPDQSRVR